MEESDLDRYTRLFRRLRVDHNKNRYTTGKAPHKATLLLSLIILSANKRQDLSNIKIDLDLRETWVELWKCLDYDKPGPIHLPLYHLVSSDFWNIDLKEGISPHPPSSLDQFQKMILKISMKDDLIGYCHWRSKSVQLRRNKTVHLLIPELKLRGCADAGHGGVPRVARFIQPGIEHK